MEDNKEPQSLTDARDRFRDSLRKSLNENKSDDDSLFGQSDEMVIKDYDRNFNGITISDKQYEAFMELEYGSDNIFLTGDAGTGKSIIIKYFLKQTKKNVAILAPTGVAAANIGGQTIHSFFRIPPKPVNKNMIPSIYSDAQEMYRKVEYIIIDEMSMVRCDIMDYIDAFLRRYGGNSFLPFGGKKIVGVGDLFQLPPVIGHSAEKEYIDAYYNGIPYFFNSDIYKKHPFKRINLTQVHRQSDPYFISTLNLIRYGIIQAHPLSDFNDMIHRPQAADSLSITTTNSAADYINQAELDRNKNPIFCYTAKTENSFDFKSTKMLENLLLKEGAKVMTLINHSEGLYVNGSVGVVTKLTQKGIIIEIDGAEIGIEPYTVESFKHKYNGNSKRFESEITGNMTQYPLMLAFAISIHKSQGMTFEKVHIDMDRGAFATGQTYVALSRVKSIEGLSIARPIQMSDIMTDNRILEFTAKI